MYTFPNSRHNQQHNAPYYLPCHAPSITENPVFAFFFFLHIGKEGCSQMLHDRLGVLSRPGCYICEPFGPSSKEYFHNLHATECTNRYSKSPGTHEAKDNLFTTASLS